MSATRPPLEPISSANKAVCQFGQPVECGQPAAFVGHVGDLDVPWCAGHAQHIMDLAQLAGLEDHPALGFLDQLRVKRLQRRVDGVQREHQERLTAAFRSDDYRREVQDRFGVGRFGPNTGAVEEALASLGRWREAEWRQLAETERRSNGPFAGFENPFWTKLSPEREDIRTRAFEAAASRRDRVRLGEHQALREVCDAARAPATDAFRAARDGASKAFAIQSDAYAGWQGAVNLLVALVLRPFVSADDFAVLIEPYRALLLVPGETDATHSPPTADGGLSSPASALPPYLGLAWLDRESVHESQEGYGAAYGYEGDVVYRVENDGGRWLLEEFRDGKRTHHTRAPSLEQAVLTHANSLCSEKPSPFWLRLADRVPGAWVNLGGESTMLATPAMALAVLRLVDTGLTHYPQLALHSEGDPDEEALLTIQPSANFGALVRRWQDGTIATEPVSLIEYVLPAIFVPEALRTLRAVGYSTSTKEERPIVEPAPAVDQVRTFVGERDRGLATYAVARTEQQHDLVAATSKAERVLRSWDP